MNVIERMRKNTRGNMWADSGFHSDQHETLFPLSLSLEVDAHVLVMKASSS